MSPREAAIFSDPHSGKLFRRCLVAVGGVPSDVPVGYPLFLTEEEMTLLYSDSQQQHELKGTSAMEKLTMDKPTTSVQYRLTGVAMAIGAVIVIGFIAAFFSG